MTESRLDKIPNEIQLDILFYLSIPSIMCLYKTSHFWKCRISNDKQLWRSVYERNFGHEFAKDRWILWAVRRLWSQSASEEKRLAARRVSLTTLEHLDGYTWYRLVRGRILTMRNWKNNTPQRIIIFPKDQSDMSVYTRSSESNNLSYGIPFNSPNYDTLGFGIVNDTLSDTQLTSMPDSPLKKTLLSQAHNSNIVLGKIVPICQIPHAIDIFRYITNEEFIVIQKKINKKYDRTAMIILAWDIGRLEMHNTEHQSYCVPTLCMTQLLPHGQYDFLEHQSGWLLIEDQSTRNDKRFNYMGKHTRWYLLYDIRRGRLAMSFSMGIDTVPIIGKVTPDKVQIYYGCINLISGAKVETEFYQYYWHTIGVSVRSDIPISTVDLTWHAQIPTNETMERVREMYHNIMECVIDQEYWCSEGYLVQTNSADEGILLSKEMGIIVQPQHLVDDLFLLARPKSWIIRDNFLMIHSLSQQHAIWSTDRLDSYVLIPEEKAILICDVDGTVKLVSMYTGNILNSFNFQEYFHIDHIMGPLCFFCSKKRMLINVRTGEIIRTLKLDPVLRFYIRSVLQPGIEPNNIIVTLGQTCIEYINIEINSALVCEYAQI
jgi:hypothetical protein